MDQRSKKSEFDEWMTNPDLLDIFKIFLEEHGFGELISFYFHSSSVPSFEKQSDIILLVKAILKRYINDNRNIVYTTLPIHIRETLSQHYIRIRNLREGEQLPKDFYLNILVDAKKEIYKFLGGNTFSNFRCSQIYIDKVYRQNKYVFSSPF